MRILVNLDTHEVTTTPSTLKFKGASFEPVQIGFSNTGGSPLLISTLEIEFAITSSGTALAYTNTFSPGSSNYYAGFLDCSGNSLVTLLAATNGSPSKLSAEVAWIIEGRQFRSQTFSVTVEKAEIPDGVASSADPSLYPPAADLYRKSVDVASQAEANAGTDGLKLITPATLAGAIKAAILGLVNGAPAQLDTLKEIADQLTSDESIAAALTASLSAKAPLDSAALTGTPTAPTAALGTNSTQLATTAFVSAAVTAVAQTGLTADYADGDRTLHFENGILKSYE